MPHHITFTCCLASPQPQTPTRTTCTGNLLSLPRYSQAPCLAGSCPPRHHSQPEMSGTDAIIHISTPRARDKPTLANQVPQPATVHIKKATRIYQPASPDYAPYPFNHGRFFCPPGCAPDSAARVTSARIVRQSRLPISFRRRSTQQPFTRDAHAPTFRPPLTYLYTADETSKHIGIEPPFSLLSTSHCLTTSRFGVGCWVGRTTALFFTLRTRSNLISFNHNKLPPTLPFPTHLVHLLSPFLT